MNQEISISQIEANKNELKGHLFEFMIGQSLAKEWGILAEYLLEFPEEVLGQLSRYENQLRKLDMQLVKDLPNLAQTSAVNLISYLEERFLSGEKILKINPLGKETQRGEARKLWAEADLLLISSENREFPISIKLTKDKAYVNTKSGGIKSFLSSYFNMFEGVEGKQKELTLLADESFSQMGHELYQLRDIVFSGKFDEQWDALSLSHLPGELPKDMRPIVYEHYHRLISWIYSDVEKFYKDDPGKFLRALYPLCGFSNPEILQLKCFYKGKKIQLSHIHLIDYNELERETCQMELRPPVNGNSSFEVAFPRFVLQIRVKPMNIFTVPSVKINCSIKY